MTEANRCLIHGRHFSSGQFQDFQLSLVGQAIKATCPQVNHALKIKVYQFLNIVLTVQDILTQLDNGFHIASLILFGNT